MNLGVDLRVVTRLHAYESARKHLWFFSKPTAEGQLGMGEMVRTITEYSEGLRLTGGEYGTCYN